MHLIRGSRCGGRPHLRPSNTRTQRWSCRQKLSQTLLDSYFTVDNITLSVLCGHSDCCSQIFLQPVWQMEPLNANGCCIPHLPNIICLRVTTEDCFFIKRRAKNGTDGFSLWIRYFFALLLTRLGKSLIDGWFIRSPAKYFFKSG